MYLLFKLFQLWPLRALSGDSCVNSTKQAYLEGMNTKPVGKFKMLEGEVYLKNLEHSEKQGEEEEEAL